MILTIIKVWDSLILSNFLILAMSELQLIQDTWSKFHGWFPPGLGIAVKTLDFLPTIHCITPAYLRL